MNVKMAPIDVIEMQTAKIQAQVTSALVVLVTPVTGGHARTLTSVQRVKIVATGMQTV
jgi:hypothetical protein